MLSTVKIKIVDLTVYVSMVSANANYAGLVIAATFLIPVVELTAGLTVTAMMVFVFAMNVGPVMLVKSATLVAVLTADLTANVITVFAFANTVTLVIDVNSMTLVAELNVVPTATALKGNAFATNAFQETTVKFKINAVMSTVETMEIAMPIPEPAFVILVGVAIDANMKTNAVTLTAERTEHVKTVNASVIDAGLVSPVMKLISVVMSIVVNTEPAIQAFVSVMTASSVNFAIFHPNVAMWIVTTMEHVMKILANVSVIHVSQEISVK